MECHLVRCEGCLDEAEFMQMIVAGLGCMPMVRPPSDFAERTVSRWAGLVFGCSSSRSAPTGSTLAPWSP